MKDLIIIMMQNTAMNMHISPEIFLIMVLCVFTTYFVIFPQNSDPCGMLDNRLKNI